MTRVVLSLGANLGDRATTLRSAVDALARTEGLVVDAVSPLLASAPWGEVGDQPDFLNLVVLARTDLSPHDLLDACQAVETAHGLDRSRKQPGGPRPVDVDVVTYGDTVSTDPRLTLPHPRAAQREFVLRPWLQLDPDAVLPGPGGGRVADLLAVVAAAAP